jgi:predicted nucleotidyltransferase
VIAFRTTTHRRAAEEAAVFLKEQPEVDAVLLVGSAARRADANDLDVSAVVSAADQAPLVERKFAEFAARSPELLALNNLGRFVALDFHATDGDFSPQPRGWTSGPDSFELAIGNEVAYSAILWQRSARVTKLRRRWLPFYGDALREERLASARMYAINDLDHVQLMLDRDEPFHAFHRLYVGFQEFLQALFIARRTYPIAYDKWVREQVEGLLRLGGLYSELPDIIGIPHLDRERIAQSTERLRALLEQWTTE